MLHNGGQWYCEHCRNGASNLYLQNIALTKRVEFLEQKLDQVMMKLEQQDRMNSGDAMSNDQQKTLEITEEESAAHINNSETIFGSIGSTDDQQVNLSSTKVDTNTEDDAINEEDPFEPSFCADKPVDNFFEPEHQPICSAFANGGCSNGIKGKNCPNRHPKQCRKFLQGGRTENGCKDWNCRFFHPRICKSSYLFGTCLKKGCKERHIKNPEPQPNQPLPANPLTQSTKEQDQSLFLWQRELQTGMEQLMNLNAKILQSLTQPMMRTSTPIWEQARPTQQCWSTQRQF
jgi:hypothetical protein